MTAPRSHPFRGADRLRRLRGGTRDDGGMALPAVVALMLVSALLVTGVMAATLNASGSAATSRTSVRAQAAAEAGLAAAQSAIVSTPSASMLQCTYSSSAEPAYGVQVQYGSGVTGAPTCPAPTGALTTVGTAEALIVSTGRASSGAQSTAVGGVRRVQGVLRSSTTPSSPPSSPAPSSPPASGSSGSGGTPDLALFGFRGVKAQNWLKVVASTSGANDAAVYAESGGVSCSSQGVVEGRVMSQSDITLPNRCTLGAIWSGGKVVVQDATVSGDVFAASTSTDGNQPAFRLTNSSAQVKGNVYANGAVRIADGSVGGSVLSTAGDISLQNQPPIRGSAYGALGVALAGGSVGFDVVSTRGSLSDPQNPGATVGRNAAVAGCISSKVRVTGTSTPAANPSGRSCSASSPTTSSPALPDRPKNPDGVPETPLPSDGTVSAPPRYAFPTLPSRAAGGGSDPLEAWRSGGWDVQVFPRSGASGDPCTQARGYLGRASDPNTAEGAAWAAKPLLLVIRECSSALQMGDGTVTLRNDLAIMSDRGISNQNNSTIRSSVSGTDRNLYWIVPSDSPVVDQSSFPTCSGQGVLTPSNLTRLQDVRWFLYTPCSVTANNSIGSSDTPVRGALYAGSIDVQQLDVKFTRMTVPGLSGGGVTGTAASGGSSGTGSSAGTSSTSAGTTQAAVFGGSSVSMRTKNTLFQSSGNAQDALVYAGAGGFECQNNGEVQGPLRSVASGATFKNSCTAASVTAPAPAWTFPTLPSRTSGGPDPLDSWRNKGWTVKIFSDSSSCSRALAYLGEAQKSGTPEEAAWRTAPLLVVVRDCSSTLQWNLPRSMTLRNDLAVMSDTGIQDSDSSAKTLASTDSTAQRNFYWIVPSDTPKKTSSTCTADIEPGKVDVAASIHWLLYTPCDITPGKGFGKGAPVAGGVYAGGAVTLEQVELRFAPMTVPGLSGSGVTTSSGSSSGGTGGSSSGGTGGTGSGSGTTTSGWVLVDVRDLSRG